MKKMQPRDLLWDSFTVPWPFPVVHSFSPFLYVAPLTWEFLYASLPKGYPLSLVQDLSELQKVSFLKPFLTTGIGWLPSLDLSLPSYQSTYNTLTHLFFVFLSTSRLWEDKDYFLCTVTSWSLTSYYMVSKGLVTFCEMSDNIVTAVG